MIRRRGLVVLIRGLASAFGVFFAIRVAGSPADTGALTTSATAGAVAGAAARNTPDAPREIAAAEMTDWIDPRTATTAALRAGCGHLVELHLSRTARRAFLDVHVVNHSGKTSSLDRDSVVVHFKGGITRTLRPLFPSSSPLLRDWWQHRTFEFPSKEDFRGRDALTVELPMEIEGSSGCVVRAEMARAPGIPADPRSYTSYDSIELYLGAGARFAALGGLSELASPSGLNFDLGFGAFPWVHHGFLFDIGGEWYGSDAARTVAPDLTLGPGPHLTGAGFFLGYALRFYPAQWLDLSLRPSVGAYFLDVAGRAKDGPSREHGVFAIRSKLRASLRFAHLPDGSQFWLAPTLVHTLIPSGSFGPADVSGQTFGALLDLVISG